MHPPKKNRRTTANVWKAALDATWNRSRVDAEISIAWTRFVFGIGFFLRLILTVPERGIEQLLAGDLATWTMSAALLGGSIVSVLTLPIIRRGNCFAHYSVTIDALMALGALLPWVIWPIDGYIGFLHAPDGAIYLLVVVTAGLRLSMSALLLAIVWSGIGAVTILMTDYFLNAAVITYDFFQISVAATLLGFSGLIAYVFVVRTRSLVEESAESVVSAERIQLRFSAAVSKPLAEHLMRSQMELGGQRQKVAILFSDLRGFTSYSEAAAPTTLLNELNEYFEAMVPAIHSENGVVDKYIGDAIMAVFGIPEEGPKDAACAIRAAVGMKNALEKHNARRAHKGLEPLKHGIGIHYGTVVAGNVGTQARMNYTVIGDVVNTASRLEAMTKRTESSILISRAAVETARQTDNANLPELENLGEMKVRGRGAAIEAYAVPEKKPIIAIQGSIDTEFRRRTTKKEPKKGRRSTADSSPIA